MLMGTLSSQGIIKLIVLFLQEFLLGLAAGGCSYLLTHRGHYPTPFKTGSFVSGNYFNSALFAYPKQFLILFFGAFSLGSS